MFKLSSMYIPKLWVWKVKKKGKNMEYTHFDKHGNAVMVDVSEKAVTKRVAVAKGSIRMSRECFDKIKYQDMKKGDVLGVARIAGIMGAKKTSGVEMEALTGVQISLLTIYDMCKSVDKTMEIYEVCLCSKSGGKSGDVVYRTVDGE